MSKTLLPYPITDNADFRTWALDNPKAFALLREIIFRWRASNMKKRGYPGPWSVYPRERWAEWAGLSVPKVKRELHRLEQDGLLRRVRGRFQGSTVRTYLQPTMLALEHAGKASDRARLGPTDAPMEAPFAKPIAAPVTPAVQEPVGEPTDYTSLPSSPTEAMKTTSTKKVHPHPKGKGKAGDDVNELNAGKNTANIDDLDEDAAFALATLFLLDTDRPGGKLPIRRGEVALAFDLLDELGTAPTTLAICREGYRKTGEALPPLLALLALENGLRAGTTDDPLPPEVMIGEVPGWALDMFTREGKLALSRLTDEATDLLRHILAPATERALRGDLTHFQDWGGSLPASVKFRSCICTFTMIGTARPAPTTSRRAEKA